MISERYDWTGHNFPSEGWGEHSGSSVTWFRRINDKRFMFSAWMDKDQKVTSVQCMDATSGNRKKWRGRHHVTMSE